MRTPALSLVVCALAVDMSMAACNGSTAPTNEATATTQARLVVSNHGTAPAAMHVTATNTANNAVAIDQSIYLQAGARSSLASSLPAGTYTFAADLLGKSSGQTTTAVGSTSATVDAGTTVQVTIVAPPDASHGGPIQVDVGAIPDVLNVEVQESSSAEPDAFDLHVMATSPAGDALSYFWSGAGLRGVVNGTSTISLTTSEVSAAADASGTAVLHLVVQDAAGVATSADVKLSISDGKVEASIDDAASGGAGASASCVASQADCAASCSLGIALGWVSTAASQCLGNCGATLASCLTGDL